MARVTFSVEKYADFKSVIDSRQAGGQVYYFYDSVGDAGFLTFVSRDGDTVVSQSLSAVSYGTPPSFSAVQADFPAALQTTARYSIG